VFGRPPFVSKARGRVLYRGDAWLRRNQYRKTLGRSRLCPPTWISKNRFHVGGLVIFLEFMKFYAEKNVFIAISGVSVAYSHHHQGLEALLENWWVCNSPGWFS